MGQHFYQRFAVLENLSSPVVLGMDFLMRSSVTLHVPSRTVVLGNVLPPSEEVEGINLLETSNVSCLGIDSFLLSDKVNEAAIDMDQKCVLTELLESFGVLFDGHLGHTSLVVHEIDTGNAKPVHLAPYRTSSAKKELIESQIKDMLREGIIEPALGPWATPVHIIDLKDVLTRLETAGLSAKLAKCQFCRSELTFLGYNVTAGASGRVWKKTDVPFVWSSECQAAMDFLKAKLTSEPILVFPNFSLPFFVYTDACDVGLGAALMQRDDRGRDVVVAYAIRTLNKAEKPYSTSEKECLAVIWALEHFRSYIEGLHVTIFSDHNSLRWLMSWPNLSGRLARWSLQLQDFDFDIIHKPGTCNQVPDALSRNPVLSCETQMEVLPDYAVIGGLDLLTLPPGIFSDREHLRQMQLNDHDTGKLWKARRRIRKESCLGSKSRTDFCTLWIARHPVTSTL
ncbi:uncharacterized protein LOC114911879 [Tachysurus ichikawai]